MEARAPARALHAHRGAERGEEVRPRADRPCERDGLEAVRVVERQHRRLREGVGRAAARGVIRVALDLHRPAELALDEDAHAEPGPGRHRTREVQRATGDDVLGGVDVRDDRLARLLAARADPAERERARHELQERAAPERVEPHRPLHGILARDELAERGLVGRLLERPPEDLAPRRREARPDGVEVGHRWQVQQLVSSRASITPYSFARRGPSVAWSSSGCQSIEKTASRGRRWRHGSR